MLFEVFQQSEDGFYFQSAGQQGGKNQIYMFRMPKYSSPAEVEQAVKEYVEYYNRLNKETNGIVNSSYLSGCVEKSKRLL